MKFNWTVLLGAIAVALTVGACSGHGGGGVTCVENMPGMIMCPQDQDQVVPLDRGAPKAPLAATAR
jgi:hypothetical protein